MEVWLDVRVFCFICLEMRENVGFIVSVFGSSWGME